MLNYNTYTPLDFISDKEQTCEAGWQSDSLVPVLDFLILHKLMFSVLLISKPFLLHWLKYTIMDNLPLQDVQLKEACTHAMLS